MYSFIHLTNNYWVTSVCWTCARHRRNCGGNRNKFLTHSSDPLRARQGKRKLQGAKKHIMIGELEDTVQERPNLLWKETWPLTPRSQKDWARRQETKSLSNWAGTLVFFCPQTGTWTLGYAGSQAFGFRLKWYNWPRGSPSCSPQIISTSIAMWASPF